MLDSDAAGSKVDESRKEGTEGFVVTKEFEQLCEKEFALKQDEAYKGFDRQLELICGNTMRTMDCL